jgi:hypothetical protein
VIREALDHIEQETLTPEYRESVPRAACQHRLVTEAINAFVDIARIAEVHHQHRDLPYVAVFA